MYNSFSSFVLYFHLGHSFDGPGVSHVPAVQEIW